MAAITMAFETDMQERPHDIRLPLIGHDMHHDVNPSEMIWQRNGVTVTGFVVEHGTGAIPAFGYRIDYKGRSVLLSGDTGTMRTWSNTARVSTCSFMRSSPFGRLETTARSPKNFQYPYLARAGGRDIQPHKA